MLGDRGRAHAEDRSPHHRDHARAADQHRRLRLPGRRGAGARPAGRGTTRAIYLCSPAARPTVQRAARGRSRRPTAARVEIRLLPGVRPAQPRGAGSDPPLTWPGGLPGGCCPRPAADEQRLVLAWPRHSGRRRPPWSPPPRSPLAWRRGWPPAPAGPRRGRLRSDAGRLAGRLDRRGRRRALAALPAAPYRAWLDFWHDAAAAPPLLAAAVIAPLAIPAGLAAGGLAWSLPDRVDGIRRSGLSPASAVAFDQRQWRHQVAHRPGQDSRPRIRTAD